jgi:hypothetical protein
VSIAASTNAEPAWPGYQPQLLRWNENYSAQCSSNPEGLLRLKCLPLGPDAEDSASIGAEYRLRVEDYAPFNFGLNGANDISSVQHRALLHSDFHFGDDLRIFVQLGSASERGRPIQRPGDEDDADVVQAFADFNFSAARSHWRLRAGRQELAIGRFVAIRDATNIRRTFDGVRIDGSWSDNSLLAVAARTTHQRTGAWDNNSNADDRLAVIVLSQALGSRKDFKLDFALLEHDNNQATYAVGAGRERRRTVGLRLFGARGPWDIDSQASYQFGDFTRVAGEMTIDAWGAAFEGGATFKQLLWSPRIAIRVDVAGGDRNASDRTLNTFDVPYPNLSYLTDAAFFAPRNVWDIQPFVSATVVPQLTLTIGSQFLWRLSQHDAVYSSANIPLIAPSTAGNYVAGQPYLRVSWRPISLISVQGSLEKAFVGEVLRHVGARNEVYEMVSITIAI